MKMNKKKMAVSSFIIMLPVILNIILWDKIKAVSGMSLENEIWMCVFPYLVILVFQWLGMFFTFRDPRNQKQTKKAANMIYWITPVITIAVSCIMYASIFRIQLNLYRIMEVLFGFMFVVIGNYLPKYRQNTTMGVKVKWTLQSEDNWNKTHRFSGKLWATGGVLLILAAFLPREVGEVVFVPTLLVLAFVPILFSYVYYKKQVKEGIDFSKVEKSTMNKRLEKATWIFLAVVVVIVGISLFTGNINVQYKDESVTIKASYWSDMTINYEDIKKIEFKEEMDPGIRTWGLGTFHLLAGSFENSELGYYTRYSYYNCKAGIVLETKEDTIVLSGKDQAETKEIYHELRKRIGKK